jgi:hypothetical protein
VGKAGGSSSAGGFGREAAHVVLYEDVAKRRVKVLVAAMRDLQALQEALQAFGEVSDWAEAKDELLMNDVPCQCNEHCWWHWLCKRKACASGLCASVGSLLLTDA